MPKTSFSCFVGALALAALGCSTDNRYGEPTDPDAAPSASIDRFSEGASLFNRDDLVFHPAVMAELLPGPNEPIDMDAVFLNRSFGPGGTPVLYYGLDIQSALPARAFVFVDEAGAAIDEQLPVLEFRPGQPDYSDFVQIFEVNVGNDYPANALTSVGMIDDAVASGRAAILATERVENWAQVPAGSTASLRFDGEPVAGHRAWIDGEVVSLLRFDRELSLTEGGAVPLSNVIVIFEDGMSPAEGFAVEPGTSQTHNVFETLPGDAEYSSLWQHQVGARDGFDEVSDWESAVANATGLIDVRVNCPVVE